MPYGVDAFGDWLIVADTANSRLLGWKNSTLSGADADALVGQKDFKSKSENGDFGLPKRDSVNWCYGINICGDIAVISDSGNNRILLWRLF
jgi:hypothetical protein